jgi:uncharacterized protein with PIN domain
MAHGSPRLETCKKCSIVGYTPRFSESKCPKCGGEVEQIEKSEAKRRLGIMIHEEFTFGFTWKEFKTDKQ